MVTLYTETIGQGADIVLLHGWGMHSQIWHFTAEKLSKLFRVTLVDLPGFGRSQMIADYTTDTIADELLKFTPSKAIWLGWSLGGLIATKMALRYPERVTKLICISSSPKFLRNESWPGINRSVLNEFSQQLAIDYEATLMRFLVLQFFGTELNHDMLDWLSLTLFAQGKPTLQALQASLALLEQEDLRSHLAQVTCPLLYLLGKKDAIVPARVAIELKQLNPNINTLIFPKASHAPFLSHEAEFITQVRNFTYD